LAGLAPCMTSFSARITALDSRALIGAPSVGPARRAA
jgi:hypothetical protein